MDVVAQQTTGSIPQIIEPTTTAFIELLEERRSYVESIPKKTFQYGSTDRHQLDVFYPSSDTTSKPPILLFTYGGGLVSGDRVLPNTKGLVYTNVGAFFAHHGFLTVTADYRLVSAGAVHPEPLEDVRDALEWTVNHLSSDGDTNRIFMISHSAGAMIQSSLLFHPTLLSPELRSRIKGVVLNGGAYHFDITPLERQSMPPFIREVYFVPPGTYKNNTPVGLLAAAPEDILSSLPPLFIVTGEKEPEDLVEIKNDFVKLLKEKKVTNVTEYENMVHNHISTIVALSSGQGETWEGSSRRVVEEILRLVSSRLSTVPD